MSAVRSFSTGRFPKPITDELELIGLSQQGDTEAFACLYERYVDRIYHYILFRVGDGHLAEDITSHVFIKMWEKLPNYQVGQSPMGAWLYRIAHNAVIDHYRTRKALVPLEHVKVAQVGQEDEIVERLDLQIRLGQLRNALQNLTEGQRAVLTLRFLGGLSVQEIAGQLGKRPGAVRSMQMRGLRELAKVASLR